MVEVVVELTIILLRVALVAAAGLDMTRAGVVAATRVDLLF